MVSLFVLVDSSRSNFSPKIDLVVWLVVNNFKDHLRVLQVDLRLKREHVEAVDDADLLSSLQFSADAFNVELKGLLLL